MEPARWPVESWRSSRCGLPARPTPSSLLPDCTWRRLRWRLLHDGGTQHDGDLRWHLIANATTADVDRTESGSAGHYELVEKPTSRDDRAWPTALEASSATAITS